MKTTEKQSQIFISVSIDIDTKEAMKALKEAGFNISAIFRKAVKEAAQKIND